MPPTGALVAPELDGDMDDEATAALLASLALPLVRRRAPRAWRRACNRWAGRPLRFLWAHPARPADVQARGQAGTDECV
jgi:hypothetical protein